MAIILIGYMGSGKTAVGSLLSSTLKTNLIDLDQYIETQEQMSISEIFQKKGEIYFRKKEYLYLKTLLDQHQDNTVLSLGGGTPCYGMNMELINKTSEHVFYLKASIETLFNRLRNEKEIRPLIKDIKDEELSEFIRKHLFERNFYYLQAKHKIAVDAKSIENIVKEIKSLL